MLICVVNVDLHRLSDTDSIAYVPLLHKLSSLFAERKLDQPALQLLLHLLRLGMLRQQRNGFDVYELCSHFEEFSRYLHILNSHPVYVIKILLQQKCYRDIIYIQLMLGDKVQQQIKRTFKNGQLIGNLFYSNHLPFI